MRALHESLHDRDIYPYMSVFVKSKCLGYGQTAIGKFRKKGVRVKFGQITSAMPTCHYRSTFAESLMTLPMREPSGAMADQRAP